MSHIVILDPITGLEIIEEHEGEGGEQGGNRQATNWKSVLSHDHAPSEIVIKGLNLEDANKVLKLARKLTK